MLDITKIKADFPILKRRVNGKQLVYLDNAATSQKPKQVIEAISDYYKNYNANVHRGIHALGDEATGAYIAARQTAADFIGAEAEEIIFVRNTTEAINLLAFVWGTDNIGEGDVILTTEMEHHSNIVPWQNLVENKKARLEFVKVDTGGRLEMGDLERKLKLKPKLVTMAHVSNFLGTINPVQEIAGKIKNEKSKISILVDGAQAVPHMKVDVRKLGVDFYAFSGHKMLGPMGIGVLWVKKELLEKMKPFLVGGGMIDEVTWARSTFADLPDRFDAGTPNVAGAIGLRAAIEYLGSIGIDKVGDHEKELTEYMLNVLKKQSKKIRISLFGPKDIESRRGVVSFIMEGIHAHDVAQILDKEMGVAVRSGHHCTMPMHSKFGLAATTRASIYIYNDKKDIDILVEGLARVRKVFS